MVLGTLATSFDNIGNNSTLNPIGNLDEIPGPLQDTHVLETKPGVIYELGEDNPFNSTFLTNTNLVIKMELQ